jgi:hypothetical protein
MCYNVFLKRKPKKVSIMLKRALGLGLITGVIGVGGAISYADETKTAERQIPVVKCSEPAYSVMVMEFDCKASRLPAGKARPSTPSSYI